MAATWPPSLQQFLNQDGFGLKQQPTNIRTKMETGPTKVRRRFTNPQELMGGTIWLKDTQYATFKDFYNSTLLDGSLTFDFVHPLSGQLLEWRFMEPYQIRGLGGEWFVVTMQWESIPA